MVNYIKEPSWSWLHCSWWGVLDKALCDKVCQWLAAGQWFSPGTSVSSTNKTDPPYYYWNIVESGIKHHNPNPPLDNVMSSRKRELTVVAPSKFTGYNKSVPCPCRYLNTYNITSQSPVPCDYLNTYSITSQSAVPVVKSIFTI